MGQTYYIRAYRRYSWEETAILFSRSPIGSLSPSLTVPGTLCISLSLLPITQLYTRDDIESPGRRSSLINGKTGRDFWYLPSTIEKDQEILNQELLINDRTVEHIFNPYYWIAVYLLIQCILPMLSLQPSVVSSFRYSLHWPYCFACELAKSILFPTALMTTLLLLPWYNTIHAVNETSADTLNQCLSVSLGCMVLYGACNAGVGQLLSTMTSVEFSNYQKERHLLAYASLVILMEV